MRTIQFTKMSGSGNDFLVIDNRRGMIACGEAPALARSLCQHRLSVGADGIVLLSALPDRGSGLSYSWRYINADGSDGEMCGNGAMCAARFAVRAGIAPPHHSFSTPSGIVEAWVDRQSPAVSIALVDPGPVEDSVTIQVAGRSLNCTRIVVGVPHVVIVTGDADGFADSEAFNAIGKEIRHHPLFAPAGTNVNVVSLVTPGTWRMRTYERGVEAETLACGTGAVASAIVLEYQQLAASPTSILTSSGRALVVDHRLEGRMAAQVRLTGHAGFIYDGTLLADAMDDQDSSQKTRLNSCES